jgi:hypothetical protein
LNDLPDPAYGLNPSDAHSIARTFDARYRRGCSLQDRSACGIVVKSFVSSHDSHVPKGVGPPAQLRMVPLKLS